ncbi:anti-sigma factor [Micromonospora auratinigra]|uniref:Anti-sigma-K factor rskA n=1 Tax=Micromonospora auratinigra TaxID=261654 RepID=A0A1A8Z4E8_9ACTN|nr:anti-sigma factor [Micromonospora auratinigra]SBT38731.1 Anti-sigma-K factor rskA [Micromonospora auratinigra]
MDAALAQVPGIEDLLRRGAVWAAVPTELEARILAHVSAAPAPRAGSVPAAVGASDRTGRALRRRHLFALAAGVTALAGIGAYVAFAPSERPAQTQVALAGTGLAETSRGDAVIEDTASGVRLALSFRNLPAAAAGTYYEGWVAGPRGSVAIGTFHLRKGSDGVVLWSGVDMADYPTIKITLQKEGGGPASSGNVLLIGETRAD